MGRPRNSSNPMHPSRLLKSSSSTATMTLMNLHLPAVAQSNVPRALEEDLESQARASIGLFGFGSGDGGVTWSRVAVAPPGASGFDMASMGSSTSNSSSLGAQSLLLMERVCPVGTNATLWNTMHNGETINPLTGTTNASSLTGDASDASFAGAAVDGDDDDDMDGGSGHGSGSHGSGVYLYGSKVLQQYLVKAVTLLPASLEEVIELLVRSDGDDMETPMHHLAGIKTMASGLIYRRRKKRLRRRHLPSGASSGGGSTGTRTATTTTGATSAGANKSLSSTAMTYDSDSSSSSSDDEDASRDLDDHDENQQFNRVSLHTAPPPRPSLSARKQRAAANPNRERVSLTAMDRMASTGSNHSAGYMDDYTQSLLNEAGSRGNLSLKWVVGERPGRVFNSRVHLCLLDYECIIINDWDDAEDNKAPMYVRTLQSCYLPQCQPWMDEFGTNRPSNLQPTGFMVRESRHREGFVEIQFVGAILEKAQLPNARRRAKLRSLVARIAKLEEIITSRRLSQSLLAHQPLWVRNNERSGCYCCDAKFGLSRRRHHCRLCGEVCCSECSPKMDVALPDVGVTSVRVCVACLRRRRQSTDFVSNSSVSSAGSMGSFMPSPRRGPSMMTPPTPPLAYPSSTSLPTPPPPPPSTSQLSSSSSSEYLSSSSYGSMSSSHGGIMGERKQSASITSTMLQRFKSG